MTLRVDRHIGHVLAKVEVNVPTHEPEHDGGAIGHPQKSGIAILTLMVQFETFDSTHNRPSGKMHLEAENTWTRSIDTRRGIDCTKEMTSVAIH